MAEQETVAELGQIPPPITAEGPKSVPGEKDLTQDFNGQLIDESYKNRGYQVPGKVSSTLQPIKGNVNKKYCCTRCCESSTACPSLVLHNGMPRKG